MIALTKLKNYLNVKNANDDDLLIDLEAAAVSWFANETHRYLGLVEETTEVIAGTDRVEIWLKEVPTLVNHVYYRSFPGGQQTEILSTDDNGYETREGDPRLYRKGGAIWSKDYEFVVEYERGYPVTAGYDDEAEQGTVPADVRLAVKDLVRLAYKQRTVGGSGPIQSEKIGADYSYTLVNATGADAKVVEFIFSAVNRYQRRFV